MLLRTSGALPPHRGASGLLRAWAERWAPQPPPVPDTTVTVVVQSVEGGDAARLLSSLEVACDGDAGPDVVVVDDRDDQRSTTALERDLATLALSPSIVSARGQGWAGGRNLGMRAATTEWVVVLDDDHVVDTTWYVDLLDDLRSVSRGVAGVAARVDRSAPEDAPLATDVAYRRLVALSLGGYQARFPRAACTAEVELAHRVANAGWVISSGRRSSATAAPRDGRGISDTQAGSPEAETFAADIEG